MRPVSGGDINNAFQLQITGGKQCFLKFHPGASGGALLAAEQRGLEEIRKAGVVATPGVLAFGADERGGWLVLEFLEGKPATGDDWASLGRQLAGLHQVTAPDFGFDSDNFIGTLTQSNRRHQHWAEFYREERLRPQFQAARSWFDAADHARIDTFLARLPSLVDPGEPALIHGDLWSGNVLISGAGPVLIDPAVCYAHREMDLAMSMLFGGFDRLFYESYHATWPLIAGWRDRIELYQLYYLLAHLNMFGAGYLGSVMRIVRRFA